MIPGLAYRRNELLRLVLADTDPTPTATACSPTTTSHLGGSTIAITGTGFMSSDGRRTFVQAVYFGSTLATSFTVTSATNVNAVAPAHANGAVSVIVKTSGGNAIKANGVTFT
jgi:VCBS repeat-containing protein